MSKKHARRSCSSSKRWIACPGCLNLADKCPPPGSSSFAEEGTNAHYLGEICLKTGYNTDRFLGIEMCEDGGKPFFVTDEMAEAVQVYVDYVKSVAQPVPNGVGHKLMVEAKFSLEWLAPDMFGTNDALVYNAETKKLTIVDYKHGQGVVVEPEWNTQLMMYGLGGIHKLWQDMAKDKPTPALKLVETVELVIVQPRAFHPDGPVRTWEISTKDLFFWGLNVLKPAALATDNPASPLRVGDHCKFCPALAVCPEQMSNALALAKTEFNNPILPDPSALTPDDIIKVMEVSEIFNSWAKDVKAYAEMGLKTGGSLPNYKLVARRANRKWLDENQALEGLESVLGDAAFEKKVLSVAKAEKALKKIGLSAEASLDGLWVKPDNGLTMVHASDKRKEVASTAINDFTDYADFLN